MLSAKSVMGMGGWSRIPGRGRHTRADSGRDPDGVAGSPPSWTCARGHGDHGALGTGGTRWWHMRRQGWQTRQQRVEEMGYVVSMCGHPWDAVLSGDSCPPPRQALSEAADKTG